MIRSLAYVREILSNYTDRSDIAEFLFRKINQQSYKDEISFARSLSQEEVAYLNSILPEEIKHAEDEQDETRAEQLNLIFEQLV